MSPTGRILVWGLAALAAAGTAAFAIRGINTQTAELQRATVLPEPMQLPEFQLVDQDNRPFTRSSLLGRQTLLFFGFTHCPDICPAELQVMAAALDELGPKANDIIPIFITLDPERDTPPVVTGYVMNFSPRFVGLTGSPEQIAEAAKAYRVTYSKFQEEGAKPDDYTIDHVALVYLMGKDGKFLTHFDYGTPAAKMAETLRRYL
jgi:protein SCO1/2